MEDDEFRELQLRVTAHEYLLEILCGQFWARVAPQDIELIGQRYVQLLRSDQPSGDGDALDSAEQILRNALVRAKKARIG